MKTVNPSTSLKGINGESFDYAQDASKDTEQSRSTGRTIKFYTLGCKVNQYDTQVIREQFLNSHFQEQENHLPADIYIINTCTVTQRADAESFNFIRRAKKENPGAKVIVTGCLTELDEDKIKKVDSEAVIVKKELSWLKKRLSPSELNSTQLKGAVPKINGISYFKGHTRAFLKIQDGCNNFCSYCKVPLVRGRSCSKPLNTIIQEAAQLVKNGFKEIVLCGVCLGWYGKDLAPKINLVNLIEALQNLEGLLRIRLSSIELSDISDELINKIVESKKLCRHLHIPLQSGDDEILKKMNRNYSGVDYLNLMRKIKNRIPEIAITTDVLVGFPGEGEINFQNTINLIKEIIPLKVHIFPYSPREGTFAFNLKDKINPTITKQRLLRLKDVADDCSFNYKKQFLNIDMDVLIETQSQKSPDFWEGYTDNYIKVQIKSHQNLKNQLIPLRLKRIDKDSVKADFA